MKFDKKKSKFKLILTTFCCLVWLSCFCSADFVWYDYTFPSNFITWRNGFPTYNFTISTNARYSFNLWNALWTWSVNYSCITENVITAESSLSWSVFYAFSCPFNTAWTSATLDYFYSGCDFLWTWNIVYMTNSYPNWSLWDFYCYWSSSNSIKYFAMVLENPVSRATTMRVSSIWVFNISAIKQEVSDPCPTCPTIDQNYCVSNNLCPSCPSCPTCPSQYTSLECQQEYSLIPVSSVDQNYCVSNNLCPASEGGECSSWDVSWSALYINNVQHLWGAIIRVDIPEEISRDYEQWTGEFDLDVVWYNVNYEAIQDKIDLQNYKPSQEDFNNVIWVLAKYMPLIVILIWFVVIVAIIKNSFKSKKL